MTSRIIHPLSSAAIFTIACAFLIFSHQAKAESDMLDVFINPNVDLPQNANLPEEDRGTYDTIGTLETEGPQKDVIDLQTLYFVVTLNDASSQPHPIKGNIGEFRFRDIASGRIHTIEPVSTVHGEHAHEPGTYYQLYKATDILMREITRYELQAALHTHPHTFYKFQICTYSNNGCATSMGDVFAGRYLSHAINLTKDDQEIAVCQSSDPCLQPPLPPEEERPPASTVYFYGGDRNQYVTYPNYIVIPALSFRLQAPCREKEAAHFQSVTVKLVNGLPKYIKDVSLLHNNLRIGPRAFIDENSRLATLETSSVNPVRIEPCESEEFVISFDTTEDARPSEIQFEITSSSSIARVEPIEIIGNFPYRGHTVTILPPQVSSSSVEAPATSPTQRTVTPSVSILSDEQRRELRQWLREELNLGVEACSIFPALSERIECIREFRGNLRKRIREYLRSLVHG